VLTQEIIPAGEMYRPETMATRAEIFIRATRETITALTPAIQIM